jgi:hypothetical protein
MNQINEILKSKIKPKEKSTMLVTALKNSEIPLKELIEYFQRANDSEKGYCISAITQITKDKPEYIKDYLDFILAQLDHKAPRVKWEAAETIANVSKAFPDRVIKAIPKLIEFSKGDGTVIKWSAAIGITEIAKNNPQTRKELMPFIKKMAETEAQSGVKKIYAVALKILENK